MRRSLLPLVLSFLTVTTFAQVNVKDSSIATTMIFASYSFQFPGGDLAQRFGNNSSIGGGLMIKTKNNWLISGEGNYLFGSSVKNQDSLLVNISTPEGFIIDQNGYYADIILYFRGYNIFGSIGKLIPIYPNPNSGITLMAGAGYTQNKIRILNPDNTAPQLQGDYKKGYDKLNGGFAMKASVGYQYLGNTRLLNFAVGFEFIQAWTKRKRAVDFDTGKPDQEKYSSQYYGIKATWFIPMYKRVPRDYYLY
jgi:hypothetical protein